MLKRRWMNDLFVCVGLDTDYCQIPKAAHKGSAVETMLFFNCAIVDETFDLACAYKLNIAFYEAQGFMGLSALNRTTTYIRKVAPKVPIILDIKCGDIESTNLGYTQAAFFTYGADAVTINPYLGGEALQPFLNFEDKCIFVLCRTSNPGAGEFQDLLINGEPLYQVVARRVATKWNEKGNCGVIAGATYPRELKEIRKIVGDMPILIPGIGAQEGDLKETVKSGIDSNNQGIIISSSRRIIFASQESDFAKAARQKTLELHNMINDYR